ncbi:MAG TPA: hypothetical protein VGL77_13325 [Armatimonadota bacterium]|jgi:hypothetical protein
MSKYNPLVEPDADEWLALDEEERFLLIEHYHKKKRIHLPNLRAHALFHAVVENQIAMGDATPSAAKLQELLQDGLDRHEAIHAIGSVVAHMFHATMQEKSVGDPERWFAREVQKLTKESWLALGQ